MLLNVEGVTDRCIFGEESLRGSGGLEVLHPKGAPTVLQLTIIMAHGGGPEESWHAIWDLSEPKHESVLNSALSRTGICGNNDCHVYQ